MIEPDEETHGARHRTLSLAWHGSAGKHPLPRAHVAGARSLGLHLEEHQVVDLERVHAWQSDHLVHQRGQVAALRQHHVGSKRSRVVEHADREDREVDACSHPGEQIVWRVRTGHQGLRGLSARDRVSSLEHHREPGHRMGEGIHRGPYRSEVGGFQGAQVAERQMKILGMDCRGTQHVEMWA